jgi:PAS domain S-box-containing protein
MTARTQLRAAGRSRAPLVFTVVGVAAVALIWSALGRAEHDRLTDATQLTAEQVRLRLAAWTGTRTAIMEVVADLDVARGGDPAAFRALSERVQALYPGFQALSRIDRSGRITVLVPREGNEPALGRFVTKHPEASVRAAFAEARQKGTFAASAPIRLFQGGRGVASYRPILGPDGTPVAYVNGVFRVDRLVESCLSEKSLQTQFHFRLRAPSGEAVYEHRADDHPNAGWPAAATVPLPLFGQRWSLELAPSAALAAQYATWTDELAALFGLALVALLGALLRAHFRRLDDLRDSRARYRLIVENTADLIVKLDAHQRLVYVSPSYCALAGRTEAELLGEPFLPQVHDEDRAETERALRRLSGSVPSSFVEQRAMTRHGWRWLAWSYAAVLDERAAVAAVVAVGRDVTDRKELEEQLRHSQKMQAIGQLAGGVAHDFNNILQAVLGNLAFARETLAVDHPAIAELARAEHGAERAARLTRQLLAFSRQDVLRRRLLDPNLLVTEFLRMLRPAIGEAVHIEFAPGADVGPVEGDPAALEQVLMNLCLNARDAVGPDGHIRVRTEEQAVNGPRPDVPAELPPGRWVVLTVTDDGAGMDPRVLPRVFEPFFTTKERGRGTGLGLSTVYGIVRQHGGEVAVESAPGAGTTFRVFLPRADGAVPEAEPPAAQAAADRRGRGETLLLAEDDESVRLLARRALQRAGYVVVSATNGREAVELAAEHREALRLAVLDVVMPELGGREAAERIRQCCPGLPILFTSGHDPDSPALRGWAAPAAAAEGFLAKPYPLPTLLDEVRAALDRGTAEGAAAAAEGAAAAAEGAAAG